MEELHVPVPVVARIQGTNGQLGMQMVPTTNDLSDLARKIWFQRYPHRRKSLRRSPISHQTKQTKTQEKTLRTESEEEAEPRKESKVLRKKGSPFPNIYTLIHTSPAFRTKNGRIRPAVMTFAIKGQRNRRVRLTRPWQTRRSVVEETYYFNRKGEEVVDKMG